MKTLSIAEVTRKLSDLVDMVSTRGEEVVITKNGRPVAVLVSADERESWRQTLTVRGDRALMEEIHIGLAALKARRAKLYTLEELLPQVARFRIVYRLASRSRNIEIVAIGPRERIYEETFRLIQREQRG